MNRIMIKGNNMLKRAGVMTLAAVCAAAIALPASGIRAQASEGSAYDAKKTYLSLGADLKDSEKAAVYELLGIHEGDISSDQIQTVTNAEEHEYLGSYIPESAIGNRALSSVLVTEAADGSGIDVTTKNISYCTAGMYENALATAGAKDIDVVVVGPFQISGTAALVGAIKAYSEKTGKTISEETVDAAVDEMITTGNLSESIREAAENEDITSDSIEGMVAWMKEEVANGNTDNLDQMIDEGEEKFGITLTEDQEQQLKELLEKISKLDLDTKTLKEQAQNIYNKLDGMGIHITSEEAEGIWQQLLAFIRSILK